MKAPAPQRGSGKLTIGFGLVTVPVAVYNGVDEDAVKISRNMQTPAGNPVSFQCADSVTGEIISRSQTTMVFTVASGEKVELTDDEIASAMGEENGKCDLIGFYPLSQIDRYTTASVVQVRPQTVTVGKKKSRPFDKPFALLTGGMAEKGVFALLRYTLRGKPRLGVLTADGTMRVVYWDNEVREVLPMPEADVTTQELGMAASLVEALMGTEAPVMDTDAADKVRAYAETKATGVVPTVEAAAPAQVTDLMAALKASVEAAAQANAG